MYRIELLFFSCGEKSIINGFKFRASSVILEQPVAFLQNNQGQPIKAEDRFISQILRAIPIVSSLGRIIPTRQVCTLKN